MKKRVLKLVLLPLLVSLITACEEESALSEIVENNSSESQTDFASEESANNSEINSEVSEQPNSEILSDSEENSDTNTTIDTSSTVNLYYSSVDFSLTGKDLKTSLFNVIKNHEDHGYGGLYDAYHTTDVREDGKLWDMYSSQNYTIGADECHGNYSQEGDNYNREHTIPQSIFDERSPMRNDVFHVYPTDSYVNGRRSNYPHAEVAEATYTSSNGSKLGSSKTSGVSGLVFEPIDEYKGDFARTYFYFVTCYQDKMSSFKSYAAFSKNEYPSLSSWAITLYKKWSLEDPVSEKEIVRNEACYAYQGNRNPFIDFPGIEEDIW